MGQKLVKNYPSPRLMETIGATNQTLPEAVGELVANSFDARVGEEKLNIIVDVRNEMIIVLDDGKGMTDKVLEKAVCIGEDMSKHIERGEGAKGHFGMGFKTSCSTLGNHYEIYTKPINEKKEYHVDFDISEYSNRPSGADAWDVIIEDEEFFEESPLVDYSHGTAFVIDGLKTKSFNVGAVLKYLGDAFKGHIETGDKITVIDMSGDHTAIPSIPDIVPHTRIEINEVFGPKNKYKITGWMALDNQIHNDGLYGFNIYRNNQLVEKWDKSWFKSHLMTSRIIGEVNMDFLDATFYKQGLQQSEDWRIVSDHMRDYLKPIVNASRNISKGGNIHNPTEKRKIVSTLNKEYDIEIPEDISFESYKHGNGKTTSTKISDSIKTLVKEQELILDNEEVIKIIYVEKDTESEVKAPFDYIFHESEDKDYSELQVTKFKRHPLWDKKTDDEVIKVLATSDAVYRVLVEKLGKDTSEALKIRNEWIEKRVEGKDE